MRKQLFVLAASSTLFCSSPVLSADIGEQCFSGTYRSSLVEQARPDLDEEINRRYEEAIAASQAEPVIYSRSQLWNWANETKVSCGKAIGYLASNEINAEQITQCDCFYGVMFYLAN
ncbi:MAG: hypothetical protein ACR2O0_02730 [Rhizobiaceae bacterium]